MLTIKMPMPEIRSTMQAQHIFSKKTKTENGYKFKKLSHQTGKPEIISGGPLPSVTIILWSEHFIMIKIWPEQTMVLHQVQLMFLNEMMRMYGFRNKNLLQTQLKGRYFLE